MGKISDKELQEFWEWCGIKTDYEIKGSALYSDGSTGLNPELTLDNLFEYAVPKLKRADVSLGVDFAWDKYRNHTRVTVVYYGAWCKDYTATNKDPTLALYQAVQKVRHSPGKG